MALLGSIGLQGSQLADLNQWATAEIGLEARQQRVRRQKMVQERLSELLFGLELNLEEMAQYRARLLQALVTVDDIAAESLMPPISSARVPREQILMRAGGMAWRPFPVTEKLVEVSPSQRLLERSLARAVHVQTSLDPRSEPRSFHTVGIVVAQGGEGTRYGEDRVELSGLGYDLMAARDYPQVARLRLPPRYPSQADIVRLRAS